MKVLLVNDSPSQKGSTFSALASIANTLQEEGIASEIYQVGPESIAPCRGCFACREIGKCVIKDKVNDFVDYAAEFDGFIIGSPVHYSSAWGGAVVFWTERFL